MKSSKKKLKFIPKNRWIRILAAIFFFLLGIIGCLLPFAPGIPFLLYGIYLFNPEWLSKKAKWMKKKINNYVKKK